MRLLGKLVLPILILALAIAGAGYLRATRPAVEPEPVVEKVWDVEAIELEYASHQPTLELFGDLVAMRERTLQAPIAGRVVEVAPELIEGGRVEAGTVLARLDPFAFEVRLRELMAEKAELEASRAELGIDQEAQRDLLELARERLAIAVREVERYQRLEGRNVGTQAQLDAAISRRVNEATLVRQGEREIDALGLRVAQLDARLDRQAALIERAERDLADTAIRAPATSLIADVEVAVGKELRAFDPIATLIDEAGIEIRFSLRDAEFGRLWQDGLIGRPLAATWRLGDAVFPLEGEVSRIESRIDAAQAAVDVFARITANPMNAPLRPGAFLHVEVPDQRHEDVAALPATALFAGGTVYAIDEGRLVPHRVEVVDRTGDSVLVKGGIEAGRPVLASRLTEIRPGLKVEVVE